MNDGLASDSIHISRENQYESKLIIIFIFITVFFAIQPRYLNVGIKLVLMVLSGDVDLYFCSKDDLFVVKVNQTNGIHHTFIDQNYVLPQIDNSSTQICKTIFTENSSINCFQEKENNFGSSVGMENLLNMPSKLKAPFFLTEHHLDEQQPYYYRIESLNEIAIFKNVRNRLEVTISYRTHDLRTTRFFFIIRGNSFQSSTLNNTAMLNLGHVLFRQDQYRIDLFVFFCVFFSCFFLFLSMIVLIWKVKQFLDNRQAAHMHEIELEHMASRPFAAIHILFEPFEIEFGFRKVSVSLQNTPKRMLLFRQITTGF